MQINQYEEHVGIMKQLKMSDGYTSVREPYKEGFQNIYDQAKEENITISNAKEFLNSLSKEELSTLQHYTRLADDINVDKLNDEGAYNLLLNHYEKYDFNNDGFISDGIGKTSSIIPTNMPKDEKQALVNTLNSMDSKDAFLTLALLNPPKITVGSNGEIITSLNNDNHMNYDSIMERVNQILNPLPQGYTSPEVKETFTRFKEAFEKNLNDIKDQSQSHKSNYNSDVYLTKAKMLSDTNS